MPESTDEEKLRRFSTRLDDEGRTSLVDLRDDIAKILVAVLGLCGAVALFLLAVIR